MLEIDGSLHGVPSNVKTQILKPDTAPLAAPYPQARAYKRARGVTSSNRFDFAQVEDFLLAIAKTRQHFVR
ncbi:hypothetical protein, partial [Paraburkholderia sp. SIMBA_030]|uniref:hypothetical protein n=1 Tax=Paraburkholderia sp. SIMBA_030 TaxID=3085773 RepID=UPI003979ABF6